MANMYLFRIKAERPILHISTMFKEDKSTRELISDAVNENSSCETRKGQQWRIGNIENINEDSIFFAFGKIIKNTSDIYDEEKRVFLVKEANQAPHTYIAIDLHFQVCAIMSKPCMSPVVNVAGNLERLLNKTNTSSEYVVDFKIDAIKDPSSFIEMIRGAERISQFTIELGLPNPFDAGEDFQKPVERAVRAAKASKAKTVMTGENLDKEVLANLSRSAVATGNNVYAKIKLPKDIKPEKKCVSDNQVSIQENGEILGDRKIDIFSKIKELYVSIRGTEG